MTGIDELLNEIADSFAAIVQERILELSKDPRQQEFIARCVVRGIRGKGFRCPTELRTDIDSLVSICRSSTEAASISITENGVHSDQIAVSASLLHLLCEIIEDSNKREWSFKRTAGVVAGFSLAIGAAVYVAYRIQAARREKSKE